MEIKPETLEFAAPFTEQATKPLYLANNTDSLLAYKIKTTAPKLYCVRPNAHVIAPGQSVEVSIIRQGKDVPNPETKHKDKFLVLSAKVEGIDPESTNFAELWNELESTKKSEIDNKKIRVSYIYHPPPSPPNDDQGHSAAGAVSQGDMTGDDTQQSIGDFDTPAKNAAAAGAAIGVGSGAAVLGGAAAAGSGSDHQHQNGSTAVSDHATSASSRIAGSKKDPSSKREIDEANEKISSMSKQLKSSSSGGESTLSQKASSGSDNSRQVRQQPGGVPVQFVLAIALLAFFIGWKLF